MNHHHHRARGCVAPSLADAIARSAARFRLRQGAAELAARALTESPAEARRLRLAERAEAMAALADPFPREDA